MKVLIILGLPIPFPSASWTRIHFLSKFWSERGHSIDILGIYNYQTRKQRGAKKSGKVNIFNVIPNIGLPNSLFFILNSLFSFIVTLLFLLRNRPDVLIASMPRGDVGYGALLAGKFTNTQRVVDYRDLWEKHSIKKGSYFGRLFFRIIERVMLKIYASCNQMITVTPGIQYYMKRHGIMNSRLIPNGADPTLFTPRQKLDNRFFTIIYVGGSQNPYRQDFLLKTLQQLNDDGFKNIILVLVGKQPKKFLSLLSKSKVKQNVILHGEITNRTNLSHIIAQSDVGLIPMAKDYFQSKIALPVKFFEYCSCGIPVIATVNQDAILAKLINEHKVGLIVAPSDEDKFTEAISLLYSDEEFRRAAGRRARQLIENKFDRNLLAQQYLDIIKGMS